MSKFVAMINEQDSVRSSVEIRSANLIIKMAGQLGIKQCDIVKSPLPEGIKLSVNMRAVDEGEKSLMKRIPYV